MSILVLRAIEDVQSWVKTQRQKGETLALVPTMGYLHDGHVSLMVEGKARANVVAASIFVNPTQFGPTEDLARYPRDFDGDLAQCEKAGVTAVFAPEPATMYPKGYQTYVEVTDVSQGLCGDKRPGHFRGVATIVTQLLSLFRPDVALLGEKDFQQLQVIRALNRDLHFGATIIGMPTVREKDGLAMSSRNAYLSPSERERALSLSRGLETAKKMVKSGMRDSSVLISEVRRVFAEGQVTEDYIEVVDEMTLKPVPTVFQGQSARMILAGFVGKTRLIDNAAL